MLNTPNPDSRWRPYAACTNTGPGPFYGHATPQLCSNCPTAEPCLWQAMALEQVLGYRNGLWGGTSATRRHRIAASLPRSTNYPAWYQAVVDAWSAPTAEPAGRAG